jgi:hypothetical protein
MVTTNKIIDIYDGHFQLILDFPDKSVLYKIIDTNYKYVWLFDHVENGVEWSDYSHSIFGVVDDSVNARGRNIKMELLFNTSDFIKYIPQIRSSIKIIQTNIEPPYYLDMSKFTGKSKYDLLKSRIDYLFEFEMPGAIDFSPIISPNRAYLEKILQLLSED